jgi:Uncharacterized conserved protein
MLKIFGTHDDATVQQMWTCLGVGSAVGGVICADGHLGYAQPVGGVIAYTDHISVSGVGFDIGCGNMAVKTDIGYDDIKHRIPEIAKQINKKISFGVGRTYGPSDNDKSRIDHPLFESDKWVEADVAHLKAMAEGQLGTVGSGNHYVDLFRDEDDFIWIGVHFGSRGLGHKIATKYLKLAGGVDGMHVPPAVLEVDSDLGRAYIAGMELAGEYAYAGREFVVKTVVNMIAGKVTDSIHNHHNYAWKETHDGSEYWVVRKGATPAFPGQRGFVGGSMGDDALIVEGTDTPESKEAWYSTVHGAGRLYSRSRAKKELDRDEMERWLAEKGVHRIGGDLDESPMAYRRLTDVIHAHGDTVKVRHVLHPIIAVMAGNDVRDPYKD